MKESFLLFGFFGLTEIHFGYIGIPLNKKSPWLIGPFLRIVNVHPTTNSHWKIIESCIHNFELAVQQVHSIHCLLVNCESLSYFSWPIAQVLKFFAFDVP